MIIFNKLATHLLRWWFSSLLAVKRLENNGDIQPHSLFCATTVGFWRQINGDWNYGYEWLNNQNRHVTDVGGNLLKILND